MSADKKIINLFVPGRLCLFGEHSDWAGMYRTTNASIKKGAAIVTGVEQGIYATACKSDKFIVSSELDMYKGEKLECDMNTSQLVEIAQNGGFFSYVAGVASYINDNYSVGGIEIKVNQMDLPMKSGLSSSAAICVLVARAFNQLYHLKMNVKGEMQAAFRGEQRTPSRCGRLDQACAYGVKPVLMEFDGMEIDSKILRVGSTFNWVVANLMSSKDTIRILSDLNRAYPFADTEIEKNVQEGLGSDNLYYVSNAIKCLENGDKEKLGQLMNDAQANFDKKIMPASAELKAPVLHSVLNDKNIETMIYGAKGVGSQGDGTVQFLAKGEDEAKALQEYLRIEKGMPSFLLTLKPGQTVKKAVIPLAGFGTRVYPATKCMKKCFLPILDTDGLLKPALLIMLEKLIDAGIDDIALIIGEEENEEFDKFFSPLEIQHKEKLSTEKQLIDDKIVAIRQKITYVVQKERKGFGHAVWLTKKFADNEPVLLLLGDFLYKSFDSISCSKQIIDAYKECGKTLVSISEVPLNKVVHYGILHGSWTNEDETLMCVDKMVEKPTDDYAKEYLGVNCLKGERKYFATFGQYVLTPELYNELEEEILSGKPSEGQEYGLTSALDRTREKYGMVAFVPNGKSFDIGLPEAYRQTMFDYSL